jgi:GT2 family glycosyltransferase
MPTDTIPLCSVCIANYNGMNMIADCIRSVLAQEGDIPFEILVHDDASTDGSADYIRTQFPEVVLIESQENVGFCVANNRMAAQAKGHYLLLLNNDAALLPDALDTFLRGTERLGEPCILGLPQFDWSSGRLIDRGCLLDPFLNAVPNLDPGREEVAVVAGACLWIPRGLWIELGGFPEWFGSMAEDHYLCCCARLAGYHVRCLPGSGFRHRTGRSFGGGQIFSARLSTTFRRRALSERNRTYAMAICYPWPALFLLLPLHLVSLMAEGLLLSLLKWDHRYWGLIYGPALTGLWLNRRQLIGMRARTQAQRVSLWDFFSVFVAIPYKLRMLLRYGLPDVA